MGKYICIINILIMQCNQPKNIKHPVAVKLIEDIIDLIPTDKRGTYDRADPTAYSRGAVEYRGLRISYWDCTWGISLQIFTVGEYPYDGLFLAEIYLDCSNKELLPRHGWSIHWFKLLHALRPQLATFCIPRSKRWSRLNRQYV